MVNNLIGSDITLMRQRYDEALQLQGIPCTFQFPNLPDTNVQGESVIDSLSEPMDVNIFFDGNPTVKTFKRYGWVVENSDNLPFILHCSWNLPNVQRDAIFRISGQYAGIPDRVFKVTEISFQAQAPDHLVCQVVPVYESQVVGRTHKEVEETFNSSNHFLKSNMNYRGRVHVAAEDLGGQQ